MNLLIKVTRGCNVPVGTCPSGSILLNMQYASGKAMVGSTNFDNIHYYWYSAKGYVADGLLAFDTTMNQRPALFAHKSIFI